MTNDNFFMRHKKKFILLGILAVCFLAYLLIPSLNREINRAVRTLSSMGIDGVIEYIRSYGPYAAAISFFLMILQSLVSPIPAFLITLSNAAIFGWAWGALLSWTSSMVGAILCFYIARILGRDVVVKFTSHNALQSVDDFFKRYGKAAILVARLLPFISFDLVSYAAGLTSMGFLGFVLATGIGQLPATLVYSYVGGTLTGGAQKLFIGLLCLFALSIIIAVGKKMYNEKRKAKESASEENAAETK